MCRVDCDELVRTVIDPVERARVRIKRQILGGVQSDRSDRRARPGHRVDREELVRFIVNAV